MVALIADGQGSRSECQNWSAENVLTITMNNVALLWYGYFLLWDNIKLIEEMNVYGVEKILHHWWASIEAQKSNTLIFIFSLNMIYLNVKFYS